jgi:hypothetical protein
VIRINIYRCPSIFYVFKTAALKRDSVTRFLRDSSCRLPAYPLSLFVVKKVIYIFTLEKVYKIAWSEVESVQRRSWAATSWYFKKVTLLSSDYGYSDDEDDCSDDKLLCSSPPPPLPLLSASLPPLAASLAPLASPILAAPVSKLAETNNNNNNNNSLESSGSIITKIKTEVGGW